jgi:IclR family acetate operon transcriptional repressor
MGRATPGSGTQAIERAAQLLVRVVESPAPVGVGELAATSGLPKSTTSRLVSALERQGLVQRVDGRALRPGPVLLRFAHRGVPEATLVELADPVLAELARVSGETVNLAVPGADGPLHLAQRDGDYFVGTTNWVGRRVPHHASSNGKVFIAFGAVPLPERLEKLAPRTITDPKALERGLARVRARGWASTLDELELGLAAVAAPVHGPDGSVVAALSISGPTIRLTSERIAKLAPLLVEQARELELRLGHHDVERGAA